MCTTWLYAPDQQRHLLDVWQGRGDYPGLKAKVQELASQWRADRGLAGGGRHGDRLLQELKRKVRGFLGIKPERDKVTRVSVASAKFETGQVHFPETAPGLPDLETELFS